MASMIRPAAGPEFGVDAIAEVALLEDFGVDAMHPATAGAGLERRLERWIGALMESEAQADAITRGRVAWLACDGPTRWRDEFLSPAPTPAFVEAFRAALPSLAPAPAPLRMPEQALRSERPRRGVRARVARLFGPGRIAAQ